MKHATSETPTTAKMVKNILRLASKAWSNSANDDDGDLPVHQSMHSEQSNRKKMWASWAILLRSSEVFAPKKKF